MYSTRYRPNTASLLLLVIASHTAFPCQVSGLSQAQWKFTNLHGTGNTNEHHDPRIQDRHKAESYVKLTPKLINQRPLSKIVQIEADKKDSASFNPLNNRTMNFQNESPQEYIQFIKDTSDDQLLNEPSNEIGIDQENLNNAEPLYPMMALKDDRGFQKTAHMTKRAKPMFDEFYGDAFHESLGSFQTMRRKRIPFTPEIPHRAIINSSSGSENEKPKFSSHKFHDQPFKGGRYFDARRKRRPEMGLNEFYDDAFSGGIDSFDTMRKRRPEMGSSGFHRDAYRGGTGSFGTMHKKHAEMSSSGFHGDDFRGGMGSFETMRKRRPEMGSSGFHGDAFSGGVGSFDTMRKRRPEMSSSGFHSDAFRGGMGSFETMRKRRPEMGSSGFHGDAFSGGMGSFDTMRKRRPRFYGDVLGGGIGTFGSMRERRREMGWNGPYDDAFSGGLGPFDTMRK